MHAFQHVMQEMIDSYGDVIGIMYTRIIASLMMCYWINK